MHQVTAPLFLPKQLPSRMSDFVCQILNYPLAPSVQLEKNSQVEEE